MKVDTFVRWLNARLASEHAVDGIEDSDLVDGVQCSCTFDINADADGDGGERSGKSGTGTGERPRFRQIVDSDRDGPGRRSPGGRDQDRVVLSLRLPRHNPGSLGWCRRA